MLPPDTVLQWAEKMPPSKDSNIRFSRRPLWGRQVAPCVQKQNKTKTSDTTRPSKCTPIPYHWQELPQVPFLSWQVLSWQNVIFRDKSMLAVPKRLLRQNYICQNKIVLSRQKMCFVMTNTCLSWQNLLYWQKWYLLQLQPQHNILRVRVPPAQFPWS